MKVAARKILGLTWSALAIAATATLAHAGPVGYSAWDVAGVDKLVRFDLSTGVGTVVGTGLGTGHGDVDGLAFSGAGQLYGVDDDTNRLLSINHTTGVATEVGSLGTGSFNDMGLAFIGNTLYMSSTTGGGLGSLFSVNTATGAATLIGDFAAGVRVRSLGSYNGVLYGWSNTDTLLNINTTTGVPTTIGAFGFSSPTVGRDGMDIDPATGTIWSIGDSEPRTYTLNSLTGAATVVASNLTCDGTNCSGFNSLAINAVPEPETYAMMLAGLGLLGFTARRRKQQ